MDLNTLVWTRIEPKGDVPSIRYGHCVEVYNNCMYLLFGTASFQEKGAHNDIYEYNFETQTFKKWTTKLQPRFWPTSFVKDGKIWVIGGTDTKLHFNEILTYDLHGEELPLNYNPSGLLLVQPTEPESSNWRWSTLEVKGTPPSERYSQTTVITYTSILLFGISIFGNFPN